MAKMLVIRTCVPIGNHILLNIFCNYICITSILKYNSEKYINSTYLKSQEFEAEVSSSCKSWNE